MVDSTIYFRVPKSMQEELDRLVEANYMATRGEYLRSLLKEKIDHTSVVKESTDLAKNRVQDVH